MSALARRMSTQQALALPSPAASNTVVINARCSLRIEAGQRVIIVAGLPVHHYCAEDAVAEAYAMVFLVESGFAQQTDVARAFADGAHRAGIKGAALDEKRVGVAVAKAGAILADMVVSYLAAGARRPIRRNPMTMISKIADRHLSRQACIYIRQSTLAQVRSNQESTDRQYTC